MRFDTPLGVLRAFRPEAGEEREAFFGSGADRMPRYYLYNNSLPFHCTGIAALSQLGRLSGGAKLLERQFILNDF
jgi:hypothetical protein